MVSVNALDVTRDMLAYTLTNDKTSLVKLLSRNGVQLPSDASDREITMAVLMTSAKSSVFKNELSALLSSKIDQVNKEYSNFVGGQFDIGTQEDKTMFTGSEDFFNIAGGVPLDPKIIQAAADAKAKSSGTSLKTRQLKTAKEPKEPKEKGRIWGWLGENVFTKDNINAGINMGLTALNNKIQSKSNSVAYESDVILQRQDEQIRSAAKSGGVSVGTVVLIVVGLGLVGAMVYYFTKK